MQQDLAARRQALQDRVAELAAQGVAGTTPPGESVQAPFEQELIDAQAEIDKINQQLPAMAQQEGGIDPLAQELTTARQGVVSARESVEALTAELRGIADPNSPEYSRVEGLLGTANTALTNAQNRQAMIQRRTGRTLTPALGAETISGDGTADDYLQQYITAMGQKAATDRKDEAQDDDKAPGQPDEPLTDEEKAAQSRVQAAHQHLLAGSKEARETEARSRMLQQRAEQIKGEDWFTKRRAFAGTGTPYPESEARGFAEQETITPEAMQPFMKEVEDEAAAYRSAQQAEENKRRAAAASQKRKEQRAAAEEA